MLKIPVLFLFILLSLSVLAQNSISEARQKAVGASVTVSGIVTNGSEFGTIRYMQDNSAGIAVYDNRLSGVLLGDSITLTGVLSNYNNLLEITGVSNYVVHSSDNAMPEPKLLTINQIGEAYEGQLIKVNNIQITGSSGTFSGNQNYDFTDGIAFGELRINSSSSIVGQPIPSDQFNLTAICSQYSFSTNDTQTGYQLLPRFMDDFVSESVVNFTRSVKVVDLTQNSITLGWETDRGATPFVRYGSSADKESLVSFKQGDSATSDEHSTHIAEITGLQAAEITYAQPFMVLANDTVWGPVGTYVTESESSGAIRVYFNTKVDETLADITPSNNIGQYMEDTLAAYISNAEQSIDLAIYNFDNDVVKDALNDAANRGVKIRVITCGSTAHASTSELNSGIQVLERPVTSEGGIMHNKFAIFDADVADPQKSWVWSGSTNLTYFQLFSDANNMILIQDQSLAKAYKLEFNEMWGSTTETPNSVNAKFGADKSDNTPHFFMIGGNTLESYFSPSDNTNQRLINAINSADNDLYVETMLITRSDLAGAILDAYDRGANVHVLTDAESDNASYVNEALLAGLPSGKVVFDDQQSGLMHHKVAIIDTYKKDSDPQLITGSHNWSNSANDRNDENTLIIHNADIANQFLQQFAYRFNNNGGQLVVSASVLTNSGTSVYPNPSKGLLHVQSSSPINKVELYTLNGEKIREWIFSSTNYKSINLDAGLTGMYLLKVVGENGDASIYKVVKQK